MANASHRVLLLGAGLVSRPLVRHFLDRDDVRLTVATLYLKDAEALVGDAANGRAVTVDASDESQLDRLVADADVTVSLVPYAFHPRVARRCLEHRCPMVTASYVSPEMRALDVEAQERGVLLLNEVGFDPGLDHISSLRLIDAVRSSGGTVTHFSSCAGGLPAPEASNNPWRYKFSWSPLGVFQAANAEARWLEEGQLVEKDAAGVFAEAQPYPVEGMGQFERYANRDSIKYIDLYELEGVRTMRRGTLRYPGWAETIRALQTLGLTAVDPIDWDDGGLSSWLDGRLPGSGELGPRLAERLSVAADSPLIERFRWAGLFEPGGPNAPANTSPLQALVDKLIPRMTLEPNERDLVILRNELQADWPDRPGERRVSLLVQYGEAGGDTAMAQLVSYPAAVAADLMLEGAFEQTGVHTPTRNDLAAPILDRLEGLGVRFREWSQRI